MGSFHYPMTLIGPNGEARLDALVDTGASYNWIPAPVLEQLGIRPTHRQHFALADGSEHTYNLAFVPARLNGDERPSACIFGEPDTEPLLEVVTLEIFGLGVDPLNRTLMPVTGKLKRAGERPAG